MLHAQHSTNLLPVYMDTHASERQISLQWQGLASSRDDRDVLRLAPLGLTSPKAGRFTSRAMHPQARARSASGSSITLGPARPCACGRREVAAPGGAGPAPKGRPAIANPVAWPARPPAKLRKEGLQLQNRGLQIANLGGAAPDRGSLNFKFSQFAICNLVTRCLKRLMATCGGPKLQIANCKLQKFKI